MKSDILDHVATGLLCAGAYAYASGAPIQGDFSTVGYQTAGDFSTVGDTDGVAVAYDDEDSGG